MQVDGAAVDQGDLVDHGGRRRDQVEVELAGQALLDDFQVQQAKKPAAETETQGGGGFHLVGEAGVVEAQAAHGGAQVFEVGGVDREDAAEDDRLDFLEARQRGQGLALFLGDGGADRGVGHFLDLGGQESDLAGAQFADIRGLGFENADLVDLVGRAGLHHAHDLAGLKHAVEDANQHHDAQIGVVPRIDQQGFQGRGGVALRRRQAGDDGFQHIVDADAGLGAAKHRVRGVQADDILDLLAHPLGLGCRQVDLVEDRDDLVVVVDGLVDIGQGLGLDALGCIDHQDGAFAGGQAAADFIGKVDVPRRVHQIEDVGLAVFGLVVEAHGLGLDGDAALALDIHGIEHLFLHLALGQAAGGLDQPVGQGGFAMVDVRDDGEVADTGQGRAHGRGSSIILPRATASLSGRGFFPRTGPCGDHG